MDKRQLHFDTEPPKKFKSYINNLSYHMMINMTIPTLLHYEDRSSMAHSVESRVPFLDYRLVEFGLNLPKKHLAYKNTSRPLYRKALTSYLPPEIVKRKDKLGFPTPFTVWSRTVLKDYILSKLAPAEGHFYDFVDKEYLKTVLNEHFESKRDSGWEIWRFLSLQNFLNMHK
jgi:asparagine synthase (glutamine-hydrolysing)